MTAPPIIGADTYEDVHSVFTEWCAKRNLGMLVDGADRHGSVVWEAGEERHGYRYVTAAVTPTEGAKLPHGAFYTRYSVEVWAAASNDQSYTRRIVSSFTTTNTAVNISTQLPPALDEGLARARSIPPSDFGSPDVSDIGSVSNGDPHPNISVPESSVQRQRSSSLHDVFLASGSIKDQSISGESPGMRVAVPDIRERTARDDLVDELLWLIDDRAQRSGQEQQTARDASGELSKQTASEYGSPMRSDASDESILDGLISELQSRQSKR